ncbi:MAG: tetratricopeptide repeat protein [Anaerolineae bacterium]
MFISIVEGHYPRFRFAKIAQFVVLLVLTFGLMACVYDPAFSRRLRYIPRRVETEVRRLRRHPNFVPTPVFATGEPAREIALPIKSELQPTATPTLNIVPTADIPVVIRAMHSTPTPTRQSTRALPTPTPTSTPTPSPSPLPAATLLSGFTHAWQTWNNCGPATLAMNLSYLGHPEAQADIAAMLKPDQDDKNVSPGELVAYARFLGLEAIDRVGGDMELLKRLLSYGVPVIAEVWITPKPNDGMGHYRLLIGYDDSTAELVTYDSLNGPNVRLPYDRFDAEWRVFNRAYILVYKPNQGETVAAVLADALDDTAMYGVALAAAQTEAQANPDDAFAWFNMGSSLTALGHYDEAVVAYDRARRLGLPWRMLWYQFGPFEAYFNVGRYDDVLTLAAANLRNASNLEESHYWRGRTLQTLGHTEEARRAFERALRFNPNYTAARQALATFD